MMSIAEIEKHLKQHLDPKRLEHSYGVQKAAMALAKYWGGDVEKCGLAGLIHDAGKWEESLVIQECEKRRLPITDEDYLCPQVIHAYLSKDIAREIYGITDEEVLAAVEHHCLGASQMSMTEKIVFLSDMIEEGRQGEWVETLRKLAYEDLDRAMLACYESTIANNQEKGRHVHASVWAYKKKLEEQFMESKEKAQLIAQYADDKKALDIEVISLEGLTIIADYFVVCSGTSSTHVRGIADEIEYQLGEKGIAYHHVEGYDTAKWILMDYGDVIVHVFYEEDRQYYNLERLWKAAK